MSPPSKRILHVEDNPLLQRMITEFLRAQGYELLAAGDGDEAVQLAATALPHLILMDIQLPTVSGLDATRAIKADPATAHIPVIAVTGFALSGDDEMCREAGCDDYVTKPYNLEDLLRRVRSYLD